MRFELSGKPPGCKLIRLRGELEGGILRELSIRGDFFASPEEGFEKVERRLAGLRVGELAAAFDALVAEEGVEVFGLSGAALEEILAGGAGG